MSSHLQSLSPFSIFKSTAGYGAAELLVDSTALLSSAGNNVNLLSVRATSGTAASSKTITFNDTTVTNDAAATIAIARPLGGSGLATVDNIHGIHLLLTTDPLTPAEVASGSPASRTTAGHWKLTDATGSVSWLRGDFSVNAAGQSYSTAHSGFPVLVADSGLKLTIVFTSFALATHFQILTAGE